MLQSNPILSLSTRDQSRLSGYQALLDFYQGLQWSGREKLGEKHLTFNYAKIFVDKITSYLMSGVIFTVEAVEDIPEARAAADSTEKALARVYESNNLMQLDFETETDCAILGDACYKVVWDEQTGDVRVTAPDIQGLYAWWLGDDISRVWRVASKYSLSSEEVEMLYGSRSYSSVPSPSLETYNSKLKTHNSPSSPTDLKLRTIVEVWTSSTFDLYLDGILIDSKPNPYGFIPFIIFPNLRDPKKFWGSSDLTPIIQPQRELNRALSQISHILELSGNPIAVLQNLEDSSDVVVKPGAVWNIPEDAKAYLLDLLQGGGLQLHISYIELLYRALHDISEAPRAAFGGMDRVLSGVAMQIELYPLLQKIQRKRAIRTTTYNLRNRMILDLLAKFSPETYNLKLKTYNSSSFRLRTVWGHVLPQDMDKLVMNEQILVQNGIHSRRRAMDEVGVKDPEAEFNHWVEEQQLIAKIKSVPSA